MDAAPELDIDIPSGAAIGSAVACRNKILKNGLSGVHEAFADYMLINPQCTYAEMKQVFGYSVSWICTVVKSDMFQAYFAKRREGIVVNIAQDLPSRLQAAAHLATEKVMGVIEKSEDPEVLIDAFDKVLHRLGYAPNAKGGAQTAVVNNTQNVFYLNKDDLAQAREKLTQAHAQRPELEVKGEVIEQGALPAA